MTMDENDLPSELNLGLASRIDVLEHRLEQAERRAPIASRLGWATFAIVLLSVAIAGFGLLVSAAGRNSADSTERGTDIAACRSLARGPFDTSSADASVVILDAIAEIADADSDVPPDLASQARATSLRIQQSRASYDEAVRLSITDPSAFLQACQETSSP